MPCDREACTLGDLMSERLAPPPTVTRPHPTDREVERGFTWAMVVSGIRCTISYILLPFVAPIFGFTSAAPVVGLVVGAVALVFNVMGIRRFARSNHRWKRPAIAMHIIVTVLVTVLMVMDLATLLT